MKIITRTILILSLVSLFTDISSEMLYPVMPIFLRSIGFSVFFIGIIEGIAEAAAGFSKGFFGKMSDDMGKRVPFVRFGYSLSAISKPMMALILHPLWILFARTADRLGKGVRTGARDALLSAETTQEFKGRVFGFHRAFDTIGAALGPIAALVYLHYYPGKYIPLFFLAFLPASISILITFLLKEPESTTKANKVQGGFFSFLKYWETSTTEYRRLVVGLLIFALINSSDVFLLLMAKHKGLSDEMFIGAYIFYNLVYASFSHPIGILGDKIGLKKTFIAGLVFFSMVYIGFAFVQGFYGILALFFLYGIYAAATEGISKAWITNISKKEEAGTAIGFYTGWLSVFTLIASSTAGLLWSAISPETPFIVSAIVAFGIVIYLSVAVPSGRRSG